MENELKFIFPQVVLHNFGIEFNQKITGDVFNKLRARNIGLADVFISACSPYVHAKQR
jgi:hypothetical protein